jgi:hypothetical protein
MAHPGLTKLDVKQSLWIRGSASIREMQGAFPERPRVSPVTADHERQMGTS